MTLIAAGALPQAVRTVGVMAVDPMVVMPIEKIAAEGRV